MDSSIRNSVHGSSRGCGSSGGIPSRRIRRIGRGIRLALVVVVLVVVGVVVVVVIGLGVVVPK